MDQRTTDRIAFLLLGAVLGAVIAAVVTILYAPQSGEETRELIAERGRELGGRALSEGDDFMRRVREATDEWAAKLQAAADDLVAQGRMTAEDARIQMDGILSRRKG
jgi:gas vesicle protein